MLLLFSFFFYTNFGHKLLHQHNFLKLFSFLGGTGEMNCTTYRTELENIVFKLINTHPSSMSRQKKYGEFWPQIQGNTILQTQHKPSKRSLSWKTSHRPSRNPPYVLQKRFPGRFNMQVLNEG